MRNTALEVSKSYLIRTVTHYYVGKLKKITDGELVLSDASWIADTGRFHNCLKEGSGMFVELEPFVSDVLVFRGGMIDATEWKHELPREQRP